MIIDFHTHIFPPKFRDQRLCHIKRDVTFGDLYSDPQSKMATVDDLIHSMNDDAVDVSVAMGIGWTDHGLARESNDYIIESVRKYPNRLVGFAGVNPAWGQIAAEEAERCAKLGLKGIGELHSDTQSLNLEDDKIMGSLMDVVRQCNLIVTVHSSEPVGHLYNGKGEGKLGMLWRFIKNYPDVTLVFAHWGGGLPFYSLMPEVFDSLRNVYFDTAASPFLYETRIFSIVAELVGANKILMGSDFPLLRPRRILGQIEKALLSEKQKSLVKGKNAAALLQSMGD